MNKSASLLILFLILVSSHFGCSLSRPETDPSLDKKAMAISRQVKLHNQHITSSKGTGWAAIETPEKKEKFRIAWAAIFPNKIRVTFLLSGLPVETIISTGQQATFFSHTGQHSLHSYETIDPDMGKYIHIPVKMSKIILMLLGRYPLENFNDAYFSPQDPSLSTVTLRKNTKRTRQYLRFNKQGKPDQISVTDFTGEPLYRINIKKYKTVHAEKIPAGIEIQDRLGRKLTLDITDFWVNPSVKEGVFQLTEPG